MMSLDRPDALFVAADAFFTSRRVQLISRAMRFPPSTRFCAAQSRAKFLSSSPTKFDFIINLKTAKALRLTLPEAFLMRG
jgi:hypothetical protein